MQIAIIELILIIVLIFYIAYLQYIHYIQVREIYSHLGIKEEEKVNKELKTVKNTIKIKMLEREQRIKNR